MGLRELRQKKQWTQSQLGERIGVDRGRIAEYELGKRPVENMTVGTALKILRATGHARTANTVSRLLLEDASPKENSAD